MPAFPQFDTDALTTLTDAFRARSKAITYHAPDWTISRELENDSERFNVDADGHHGKLRLSVWADGVMYFRLCIGRAKNGWDFMLSFHGARGDLDARTIVEQFLASMTSHTDTLLSTWDNIGPVVERSESSA